MASVKALEAVAGLHTTVAARAVHLHVTPAPSNLHERRGILRVLKQFGDITSFRSLHNDPERPAQNVILAIYRQAEAAQKLISDAPIQFSVGPPAKPRPNSSLETLELLQPSRGKFANARMKSDELSEREFYLTADASRADHLGHMRRQKHYWGYEVVKRTFAQEDLAQNVPLEPLSDLEMHPPTLPNRVVMTKLQDLGSQQTLRELWDRGQQERAEQQHQPEQSPLQPKSPSIRAKGGGT